MKILMATHYFASHRGGIEIVAGELFCALTANGQEVTWMAGDCTPPPDPQGGSRLLPLRVFNFVEEKIGLPFPIPTVGALRKIRAAVRDADVVVLHDCLYLANIAAFFFARSRRVPIIVVQHTVPNENGFAKLLMKIATRIFTRHMLTKADQAVFISETTKHFYSDLKFKTPPEIIFNGVNCDIFRPLREAESKAALRQKLGLPIEKPVVLFVGRFVEKKGLLTLQRMVNLPQNYTWAFAGWGPIDPDRWGSPNVRVHSGLSGASLAELYRASDVLVLPSAKEGFPLVIQEALAAGLPVVCGAETVTADSALQNFACGVPVHSEDALRTAREFLSAIDEVIAAEAGAPGLREGRRALAVSRYSWHYAAEKYIDIATRLRMDTAAAAVKIEASAGKVSR